ncbi:MAG: hypothetical protein A3K11_11975 [Nitrospirae bacterium RIFCSPLOWO2_12_FULL_63_8]|nr:MAG: hypothetical protein A3K11_11975 [Nitrospirae bacterium RIFCSPLOWO2_12_FULL_63_8]
MMQSQTYRRSLFGLLALTGMMGFLLCAGNTPAETAMDTTKAKELPKKAEKVQPKSAPPKAVTSAPSCDPNLHPKVTGVSPDHIKPGMKIKIKGNGFGKRECFKDVSFGTSHVKDFKVVSDSEVETIVPTGLKPGMMKINIQTAGGVADDTVLLEAK